MDSVADQVDGARAKFERLGRNAGRRTDATAHDRKLLLKDTLERVVRYEAHIRRELDHALGLLRQFQAERRAREQAARVPDPAPAPTPVQVDVPRSFGSPAGAAPSERITAGSFGSPRAAAAPVGPPAADAEFVRQYASGHRNGRPVAAGASEPEA
jgi:hypothetical protein